MEFTELVFELLPLKAENEGVFHRLKCCYGNEMSLFSNDWGFL